jgi:hypothetical protein
MSNNAQVPFTSNGVKAHRSENVKCTKHQQSQSSNDFSTKQSESHFFTKNFRIIWPFFAACFSNFSTTGPSAQHPFLKHFRLKLSPIRNINRPPTKIRSPQGEVIQGQGTGVTSRSFGQFVPPAMKTKSMFPGNDSPHGFVCIENQIWTNS